MEAALALPVTVSVSLILPVSKASATSSMVISLVTDAGERLSCAFFTKSTAPVSALTSTALGASTVFSSTAAKQGAGTANASIKAKKNVPILFIKPPHCLR